MFSSELCVKHVSVGRPSGNVSVEIHLTVHTKVTGKKHQDEVSVEEVMK